MLALEIRRRVAPDIWALVEQYASLSHTIYGSNLKVEADMAIDLVCALIPTIIPLSYFCH